MQESLTNKPAVVFVVDDNPDDQEWLSDMLGKAGVMQASVFSDIPSLLRGLEAAQPDIVFLDYWLDGHTSFAHLPKIKMAAPNTSIMLISGWGRTELHDLAAKFGVGFSSKSAFDVPMLAEICGTLPKSRIGG